MERSFSAILDSLEDQEAVLSDVEIHVVSGLVGDVGSKVPADKGVPISVVLPVQLIFEVGGDLLDGMHLVQGISGYSQYLALKLGGYVFGLDHRFALAYLCH